MEAYIKKAPKKLSPDSSLRSIVSHKKQLYNQLMELQNPAWRGLTNSSRPPAPAILTSVAPDCGEAGRTQGACLLASTGIRARRTHTHTHYPVLEVMAPIQHDRGRDRRQQLVTPESQRSQRRTSLIGRNDSMLGATAAMPTLAQSQG